MYKCPYCETDSYSKNSNKSGKFNSWSVVSTHTSTCKLNNKEYYIDKNLGPIHKSEFEGLTYLEIRNKFPELQGSERYIKRKFKNCFTNIKPITKEEIIDSIITFFNKNKRIPFKRDFEQVTNKNIPCYSTIRNIFGSWNAAIEAAGFEPNIQNGYGINTYGLDGHLYRSGYEALFADKYLYNKYEYVIEPKYPDPYTKYYDWYIKELDLYIELDGELRPEVTKEKIEINKKLNRNLLVIKLDNIHTYNSLEELTLPCQIGYGDSR